MSASVDSRIVELRFNNEEFEKRAAQSQETLADLKKSTEGFDGEAFKELIDSVHNVEREFSVMSQAIANALADVIAQVIRLGAQLAKAFALEPIAEGYQRYVDQMSSVQKIMNSQAGLENDQVEGALSSLSYYADETSASITAMTNSLAEFMGQGTDLDQSLEIVEGIANAANLAGANAEAAAHGMTGFAKAIGAGSMSLGVWNNWIATSGMTTNQQLLETFIDSAVAVGTVTSKIDKLKDGTEEVTYWINDANGKATSAQLTLENFKETLNTGWLSSAAMTHAFSSLSNFSLKIEEAVNETGFSTQEMLDAIEHFEYGKSSEYLNFVKEVGKTPDEIQPAVDSMIEYTDSVDALVASLGLNSVDQLYQLKDASKQGGQAYKDLLAKFGLTKDEVRPAFTAIDNLNKDITKVGKQFGLSLEEMQIAMEKYNDPSEDFVKYMDSIGIDAERILPYVQELSKAEYAMGRKAFVAGQETKSFADAIGYVKTAIANQWTTVFKSIFGAYEESKILWTALAEFLGTVFVDPFYDMADAFAKWGSVFHGTFRLREMLIELMDTVSMFVENWREAWGNVFDGDLALELNKLTEYVDKFKFRLRALEGNEGFWERYKAIVTDLATAVSFLKDVLMAIGRTAVPILKAGFSVIQEIISDIVEVFLVLAEPILGSVGVVDDALGTVTDLLGAGAKSIQRITGAIVNFLHRMFHANEETGEDAPVIKVLRSFMKLLGDIWAKLSPIVQKITGAIGGGFVDLLVNTFNAVADYILGFNWDAISAAIGNLLDFSSESNIFVQAFRGVSGALSAAEPYLRYIWQVIKDCFAPIIESIKNNLTFDNGVTIAKMALGVVVAVWMLRLVNAWTDVGFTLSAFYDMLKINTISTAIKMIGSVGLVLAAMAVLPESRLMAASACLILTLNSINKIVTSADKSKNPASIARIGLSLKSVIGALTVIFGVTAALCAVAKYPAANIAMATLAIGLMFSGLTTLTKTLAKANMGDVGTILAISLPAMFALKKFMAAFVSTIAAMSEYNVTGEDFLLASAGVGALFFGVGLFLKNFGEGKGAASSGLAKLTAAEAGKILAKGVRTAMVMGAIATSLGMILTEAALLGAVIYGAMQLPGGAVALAAGGAAVIVYLAFLPTLVNWMQKVNSKCQNADMKGIAASMLSLGVTINLITVPMAALAAATKYLGWKNMLIAIGELVLVLAAYTGLIVAMSLIEKKIKKVQLRGLFKDLAALGVGLTMLCLPLALLGSKSDSMLAGVINMGFVLAELTGVVAALSYFQKKFNALASLEALSDGMIKISMGMLAIGMAANILSTVDQTGINRLMTILAGLTVVIAAFYMLSAKFGVGGVSGMTAFGNDMEKSSKKSKIAAKAFGIVTKALSVLTVALTAAMFMSDKMLESITTGITTKLPKAAHALEQIISTAIKSLGAVIFGALPVIGNVLTQILRFIADQIYTWTVPIIVALCRVCDALSDNMAPIMYSLYKLLRNILAQLKPLVFALTDELVDLAIAVVTAVVYAIADVIVSAIEWVGDMIGMFNWGTGLRAALDNIYGAVAEDFGFEELGKTAGEQLAEGTEVGFNSGLRNADYTGLKNFIADAGDIIGTVMPGSIVGGVAKALAGTTDQTAAQVRSLGYQDAQSYRDGFFDRIGKDKNLLKALGISSSEWREEGEAKAEEMVNAFYEKVENAGYDKDIFTAFMGEAKIDDMAVMLERLGDNTDAFDYILSSYRESYSAFVDEFQTSVATLQELTNSNNRRDLEAYLTRNGVNTNGFAALDQDEINSLAQQYADLKRIGREADFAPQMEQIEYMLANARNTADARRDEIEASNEAMLQEQAMQLAAEARAEAEARIVQAKIDERNLQDEIYVGSMGGSSSSGSGGFVDAVRNYTNANAMMDAARDKLNALASETDENGRAIYSVAYDASGAVESVTALEGGVTKTIDTILAEMKAGETDVSTEGSRTGAKFASGLSGTKSLSGNAASVLANNVVNTIKGYESAAENAGQTLALAVRRGARITKPGDDEDGPSPFSPNIKGLDGILLTAGSAADKYGASLINASNTSERFATSSSALAEMLKDESLTVVITPTIDTEAFDREFSALTATLNGSNTRAAASLAVNPITSSEEYLSSNTAGRTVINFTQNNTSPKALSQYEIYRQTQNQLNVLRRTL